MNSRKKQGNLEPRHAENGTTWTRPPKNMTSCYTVGVTQNWKLVNFGPGSALSGKVVAAMMQNDAEEYGSCVASLVGGVEELGMKGTMSWLH